MHYPCTYARDSALTSIKVAAGAIPAGLILGATLVMLTYPLTESAFRTLVAEIAERRAERSAAEDAALLATPSPVPASTSGSAP